MGSTDVPALLLAIVISAAITAVLAFFARDGRKRDWLIAGAVALVLAVAGVVNLMTETPRETHMATAIAGAILPVAGGMGTIAATRRVRPWLRWLVVFLIAFGLLIAGLLLGASILPRFIGG
jgi:intracellular septation protein A